MPFIKVDIQEEADDMKKRDRVFAKLVDKFKQKRQTKTDSGIEILELGEGVYDYYRNQVKGNKDTTFDQTRRKLTRNMNVAIMDMDNSGLYGLDTTLYHYGNLDMLVVGNTVVWLKNHKGSIQYPSFGKQMNKKLYEQLTEELSITC